MKNHQSKQRRDSDSTNAQCVVMASDEKGDWSVWRNRADTDPEMIEGDLPEEIARQMVADYAAEGETVWMERTPAT